MPEIDVKTLHLYQQLAIESGKLATIANNVGMVLSERAQEQMDPFVRSVRDILLQLGNPQGGGWDGELREDDLFVETFHPNSATQDSDARALALRGEAVGVKITHRPTGINRSSYSKNSQLANREVAIKSLREAVAKRWQSEQR